MRGVFVRARPRPVLPAAAVLGHIVFATFANPTLAAFFDEKFESAPLSRESANHQFRWRFRGLDVAAPRLLKLWPNRLACLRGGQKVACGRRKRKVICAVGYLRLPSLHCSARKGALAG